MTVWGAMAALLLPAASSPATCLRSILTLPVESHKRNAVHPYKLREARAQRIPPSGEHIVLVRLAGLRRPPACYGVSAKLTLVALATRMSTGVA
jgi:hypothetical protein